MISNNSHSSYDVVVIGAGPAGAAVAALLEPKGHRCLVVESSAFPRYHVGESLIPHTHGTFDRLGLLPRMRESDFPVKHSVCFVQSTTSEATPFYFSETIEGDRSRTWQVERSEFDEICIDNARDAGAEVRMQTRVRHVLFEGDRAVGVRLENSDGGTDDVAARVVVDASGRSTVLGKQLGLKIDVPGLNKSSIWTYYRGGHRNEGIAAGETTIFMLPCGGWFWYIPLPNDEVSVGIVADPEYLFRDGPQLETAFDREVKLCEPLRDWLSSAEQIDELRGIRKLAYLNREVVGNGWVMVGDAAGFLDPIYSSGLFLALASGELAADCIDDALKADDVSAERLGAFVDPLWRGVEVIHRLIRAFYDPDFSFGKFAKKHPEQQAAIIDCLVGDVVGKDMSSLLETLAEMSPPPPPLHESIVL
ncbi:MAG: NAD(P)/FAD-dependent oxidoreductase [Planctomycetes bacterium]|nr:NAD(P)/FAD-dependent oxidoreductase [Planctomycetota bacterium]